MRVAVVGAGFTGLACAVTLVDKGVEVDVYEKANQVGGLAGGWIPDRVGNDNQWSLEYFYHHIFTNDMDIIEISKKVGLPPTFYTPTTSSLINGKILRLDSPLSVLQFSELSIFSRIRMGFGLAGLKLIKNGIFLEKYRAVDLLPKLIGKEAYEVIWEKLLKAKFGSKIETVNMAWFWSRVAKRTKNLGYFQGGFENLAVKMKEYIENKGGKVFLNKGWIATVRSTETRNDGVVGNDGKRYDKIVITTPGPLAEEIVGEKFMPKIEYLWAQTLILKIKKSFMKSYWLNILEKNYPFLVAVEHTRMISKKNYGDKTIIYLGNYLEADNKQLGMKKEDLLKLYEPYLKKINPEYNNKWVLESELFRAPFAQPVFPTNYSKLLKKVPKQFEKYLFANMSMVYPFDRGTNYAVKMGVEVAEKCFG